MTDDELRDHLDSLSTVTLSWLSHEYQKELKKRAPLDAKGIRCEEFVGQWGAVTAVFAACISGQSLLLTGPEKCGKTMLRAIASRFRPTIHVGEVGLEEKTLIQFDGAVRMDPVSLDDLLLGRGERLLSDKNWARSYFRPVPVLNEDASKLIDCIATEWTFTNVERLIKWARALAALRRVDFVETQDIERGKIMVELALSKWSKSC